MLALDRLRPPLARALRSPLLHFLVIGCAIFALAPAREDTRRVELSSASLAALRAAQASRDAVSALPPDRAREVDARAIEDEVLYREALRLGLDKDDPIIRQRLVQKLLLLVEDMGGASRPPTDAELRAYLEADPARFGVPARVHFVHVFATSRDRLPAVGLLPAAGVPALGEPLPHPRDTLVTRDEAARTYGEGFATALFSAEPARWSAPVQSGFGWHRVRVDEVVAAHAPQLAEVRSTLLLDYALDKRADVVGAYLNKTVGDYRIFVDGRPLEGFTPTRRVAVRTDPSAED